MNTIGDCRQRLENTALKNLTESELESILINGAPGLISPKRAEKLWNIALGSNELASPNGLRYVQKMSLLDHIQIKSGTEFIDEVVELKKYLKEQHLSNAESHYKSQVINDLKTKMVICELENRELKAKNQRMQDGLNNKGL